MKRVSRHFNIGIEHIYLLIGFILGFLAVLNGISLFNYYINCKNDGQEYSYKYNSIITLSSTDEDVDIERIIKEEVNNPDYNIYNQKELTINTLLELDQLVKNNVYNRKVG